MLAACSKAEEGWDGQGHFRVARLPPPFQRRAIAVITVPAPHGVFHAITSCTFPPRHYPSFPSKWPFIENFVV